MKHLLIILPLLFISLNCNRDIVDQLELEILEDNPQYYEWSYSMQEKVKYIYLNYRTK